MTVRGLDRWLDSEAYADYRARHDSRNVTIVVQRTRRVLEGRATAGDRQKVESFINRMSAVDAGARVNGSGAAAVSNRTAALRNWGRDPTGRFR